MRFPIPRRWLMLGGVAVATSACTNSPTPIPEPTADSPSTIAAQCVSLDEHVFQMETPCGGSSGGGGDNAGQQLITFGPVLTSPTGLTAWWKNAVVEWDPETGDATRLLAPKHADDWQYARAGAVTVTSSCGGTLVLHREGCTAGTLTGHVSAGVGPAVQGLVGIDDSRVASLGADNTLRMWDVESEEQLAVLELPPSGSRALTFDAAASELLVTDLENRSLTLVDPVAFTTSHTSDGMPTTSNGWQRITDGRVVACAAENDPPGAVMVDLGTGQQDRIPTERRALAVAVSSIGTIAVAQIAGVQIHNPAGATVSLKGSMVYAHAMRFSDDGETLYVVNGPGSISAFDAATGERIRWFEELR